MQKYIVANVREGTFLLFARSPLSARPTFYWERDRQTASMFTHEEARAACALVAFINGSVSNLSIEEAE
jgi:hypothetical protein